MRQFLTIVFIFVLLFSFPAKSNADSVSHGEAVMYGAEVGVSIGGIITLIKYYKEHVKSSEDKHKVTLSNSEAEKIVSTEEAEEIFEEETTEGIEEERVTGQLSFQTMGEESLAKGDGTGFQIIGGLEYFTSSHIAIGAEIMYRYAVVPEIRDTYDNAVLVNSDGTRTTLDFSGLNFLGSMRIYF